MSIHIENRDKKKTYVVEQLNILLVYNHVAKHNHRCVLAIGLAGMNARLDKDNGASLFADLLGGLKTILINDHKSQVATLRAGAE